jgi:hypothetical protein
MPQKKFNDSKDKDIQNLIHDIEALEDAVSALEKVDVTKDTAKIKKAKELILILQKQIQDEI